MAKKGSKKAASKKSGKKKASGKQNRTPQLESPFRADRRFPHTTESSGRLATKTTQFIQDKEEWTKGVRQAFTDGTDLPTFPQSKFVNPNTGQMTRKQLDALNEEFDAAIENGTKTPKFPPTYNPVLVDLIRAQNCESLRRGIAKKHPNPPKGWDDKEFGPWFHEYEDEDGETIQEPSGWFFDVAMPRLCHADRAEKLIDNPDDNILTFGTSRYVVGTGTHDGSAVFMVHQTSHGNYRAGDVTRKRLSLAGIKEIRDLVFRIEDRPNNEGGVTVKGAWADVAEMVYLPGQVLTAGNLVDAKGNIVDAKRLRAMAAEDDTKGLKFKALSEPIVGKAVHWSKLWEEIQKADRASIKKMRERGGRSEEFEAGSPQEKSITNILVHGKRCDPCEATPFGLKGSQCNMVAYIVADGEGKIEDGCFSMGVVVGERANAPYNVGVHAAKDEGEVEAEVEAETPKPKKAKAKTKAKASKAKESDEAPPVESDTADEAEAAEATS